jgi:hypothetical protein
VLTGRNDILRKAFEGRKEVLNGKLVPTSVGQESWCQKKRMLMLSFVLSPVYDLPSTLQCGVVKAAGKSKAVMGRKVSLNSLTTRDQSSAHFNTAPGS